MHPLTGIQEVVPVRSSGPKPSFLDIVGHEIISMAILSLPLTQVGRLSLTGEKYGHFVLVNSFGSLPSISMERLTDCAQNDLNCVEEP